MAQKLISMDIEEFLLKLGMFEFSRWKWS